MAEIGVQLDARIAAGEPFWLPGLADALVEEFWSTPQATTQAGYTTARWLGEMPPLADAPRNSHEGLTIEPLPKAFHGRFRDAAAMGSHAAIRAAIDAALTQLIAGDAGQMVTRLVRAIHVVEALGPGYDISHSEPSIPFSIFVSVPAGERHGTLRLAESLLHEALHLQLTLIERHVPMVRDTTATGYSPWQRFQRPLSGLLHGLYVFAGIDQWLTLLDAAPLISSEDCIYLTRRRAEIAQEIAAVATLGNAPGLTPTGRHLARWLLQSHERAGDRLHQIAGERADS